jgi:hypothetical protein
MTLQQPFTVSWHASLVDKLYYKVLMDGDMPAGTSLLSLQTLQHSGRILLIPEGWPILI